MKQKIKSVFLALLALTMTFSAVSCGSDDDNKKGNDDDASTDYAYVQDLGGEEFRVLNVIDPLWGFVTVLDPDEMTSDEVRNNIYKRNKKVKSFMNCDIDEVVPATGVYEWQMNTLYEEQILSGTPDTQYAAAFMPMYHAKTMVPAGYYQCLNGINTLHLDAGYWDSEMLKATSISNKNFFITGDVHLLAQQGMWCLYFNKNMMTDMDLAYPYQLVDDGKWTLDEFIKYCNKAANKNGDVEFSTTAENATFGCVSFYQCTAPLLYGLGADYVVKNASDLPVLNISDKSFLTTCQDLQDFLATPGSFLLASDLYSDPDYYVNFFVNQRSLFLIGQCGGTVMADAIDGAFNFGIVPLPKMTEADSYRSTGIFQTPVLTIPLSNKQPEKVCALMDALGYESTKMVVEPFIKRSTEQKGLEDLDSIRMLNIITDARSFDIGESYKFIEKFEDELVGKVKSGDPSGVSSLASSYTKAITTDINKLISQMQKKGLI